jgi:uncharacterized protein (DUF2235 family)
MATPRARKRLVVCCDGTWNRPDKAHVTNIEKIARTVETDLALTGGVQQLVYYLSGVGTASYEADRLLGGAFGLGLFANVRAAYRFLALNYEEGDELFVFGFSRGAYTARSLVGMVARVGLLTREALVADRLPEAVARYRRGPDADGFTDTAAQFREKYCHAATPVSLLGVFDTVGALGVPGALRRRHQFHDVTLSGVVECARQALALDERRLRFEPCLWEAPEDVRLADEATGRVAQVWFEGVHSDVGGGYAASGLSDTTLLWMTDQARARGLVFDQRLLDVYLAGGRSAERHDSLNRAFAVLNVVSGLRMLLTGSSRPFRSGWRRLDPPPARGRPERAVGVTVASTAAEDFHADPAYRHPNLAEFAAATDDLADRVTSVVRLPRARTAAAVGHAA